MEEVKKNAKSLSLTTDMWASKANDSYMSLTCHYMTEEFTIASHCLGNSPFPETHTANNIYNKINAMMAKWGKEDIASSMTVYIVTDNARNLTAAINKTDWYAVQCFAHTLQLTINDAKKENSVPDVI
jgi:zinc finger BED domain-containing protein 1 (E3 SUMO-protein ligase ZBED1)